MRHLGILLISAILVTGCSTISNSPINPFNWFKSDQIADTTAEDGTSQPRRPLVPARRGAEIVDQRALVERVTFLEVQDVQAGIMVTARGTTSRAGAFNADLVPVAVENGRLTLAFRVQYPREAVSGTAGTITAGRLLSFAEIGDLGQILVQGANASLSRRR